MEDNNRPLDQPHDQLEFVLDKRKRMMEVLEETHGMNAIACDEHLSTTYRSMLDGIDKVAMGLIKIKAQNEESKAITNMSTHLASILSSVKQTDVMSDQTTNINLTSLDDVIERSKPSTESTGARDYESMADLLGKSK